MAARAKLLRRKSRTTNDVIQTGVYPKREIDFSKVYSQFVENLEINTGSVLSFLGVARLESADGKRKIKSLTIESYEKHAKAMLERICREVRVKYSLSDIRIVHGLGSFSGGEPVVIVLVASPRRKQGFSALAEAVERYKKEPALFKKETYGDGSSAWIS